MAVLLLKHVVYAWACVDSDGEGLLPMAALLSLQLSLGRFFQLGRLVAARSFRDQSCFLVVLDVEIFQRQCQGPGEQFLQSKLHLVLASLVAADAAARNGLIKSRRYPQLGLREAIALPCLA
ncbi:hypothetical protein RHOFW510R12_19790 [Rhodanobacter sp. FW510-R12]